MFPIYIEQPQTQLSLSDYIHLQALLSQEQAKREHRLLQEYKKQQEQRRIERAMYKLQVLTELRRRRLQEEQAIEAYYEAKKQAHKRHLLEREQRILQQQQQEQYYAALRQKKQQELQDQYRLWASAQKSVDYVNPNQVLAASQIEQEEESEEEEEENTCQEQLAALVKLIFDAPENEVEPDQGAENKELLIETQDKVMSVDDFVEHIRNKAQSLYDDEAMEEDNTLLAMENIDQNESMDEDSATDTETEEEEVQVPSLVKSNDIHDLVSDILTNSDETKEEFTQFPDEDPVKIAKYDALNRIEQELDETRQNHEQHVLNATLDFSKVTDERAASPDRLIAATTAENRELLGYEDQLMKVLLKLDMINSDGDESIRSERKFLVKRAEDMLNRLDEFKLREWEKVSSSSVSVQI
ncbi:hypothetical protein HPULCUR_010993 [Helicostylum pulchrum]|uniref:BAG domain-containing protein n=1 Tax=Helicostylum pulchrum TaxID=562976 RepID=A0ABP9YGS6_9FUNG